MNYIVYNEKNYDDFLDCKRLSLKNIKKNKTFAIKIDLKEIQEKQMKKLIKKILKLRKKVIKNKKIENDKNGIIFNVHNFEEDNEIHKNFINALNSILKDDKRKMYEYIYDTVCNYLDSCFYGKNLCDFENNKCGEKRNTSCEVGCCRYYKNRILGPFKINNELVQCKYLKNYKCSAKCLSCKLFTCDYLQKKGIKFRIKDILLLDAFFNIVQKFILKIMVYTPKETMIKLLLITSF